MTLRIIFLFLAAITVSAESTLYDELKTNPSLEVQQPHTSDFSPFFVDDPYLYPIDDHLIEAFQRLNGDQGKDYLPQTINVNEELPWRYRKVVEDTLYLQLLLLSSVSFLTLLPQSITSWDVKELQKKSLSERWFEHVSTPPVWDHDDWVINYIGHPVSGAWYYTMARNDGMSISESAAFSALMSTFFWEYGYEAVAEVPSIQDLIFTPLLGSFLGEGMYVLEGKLNANGGLVFGSRTIGDISYFFLDPIGNIAHGMKNILNAFHIDADVTMTIQTYPLAQSRVTAPYEDSMDYREREYGFRIIFQ
ncbi:MAG: DUF3943 domain-containing protein [Campylobacterales bacterium]|nr:DUF3943 domain-containing protein [Campylobacterales bacterium]